MAAIDIFSSASLTDAISMAKAPVPFVLKNVFQDMQFHDSDKIDVEVELGSEGVAQSVHPNEDAKEVQKMTSKFSRVTIPRTFEQKTFNSSELAALKKLGTIYASAADKNKMFNKEVLRNLTNLKQRVLRWQELMACLAVSGGKIEVSQSNIEYSIDFGFVADKHSVTLTGNDLWSSANSDPVDKLSELEGNVLQNSGWPVTLRIMGRSAARNFKKHAKVKTALDTLNYRYGAVDLTQKLQAGATFLGSPGGIDTYEYNGQYLSAGTLTDMIPTDTVVLIAQNPSFRLHYAPVDRMTENGIVSMLIEMYMFSYMNENKTKLIWEIEQKSLPAIHMPDSVCAIKVV